MAWSFLSLCVCVDALIASLLSQTMMKEEKVCRTDKDLYKLVAKKTITIVLEDWKKKLLEKPNMLASEWLHEKRREKIASAIRSHAEKEEKNSKRV